MEKKMKGKIIRGEGLSKKIDFPTANININLKEFGIVSGVYAGKIKLREIIYKAAIAVKEDINKIEAYLFGYFGEDFYDEEVEILSLEKVGEIQNLSGQNLKAKIDNDVKNIKKALNMK